MKQNTDRRHIIGVDPGFVATGVAVYDIEQGVLVECQTVRTAPSPAKRNLLKGSDDMRRAKEIAAMVARVIRQYPGFIAVEIPTAGSKSGRAARAMGIVTGMMAAIEHIMEVPAEYYTPGDVKFHATGSRNASKAQVEARIKKEFGALHFSRVKRDREHQIDAAATVLAAMRAGTLYRWL